MPTAQLMQTHKKIAPSSLLLGEGGWFCSFAWKQGRTSLPTLSLGGQETPQSHRSTVLPEQHTSLGKGGGEAVEQLCVEELFFCFFLMHPGPPIGTAEPLSSLCHCTALNSQEGPSQLGDLLQPSLLRGGGQSWMLCSQHWKQCCSLQNRPASTWASSQPHRTVSGPSYWTQQ